VLSKAVISTKKKQQTLIFFKEYNQGQLISFWDKKKGRAAFW